MASRKQVVARDFVQAFPGNRQVPGKGLESRPKCYIAWTLHVGTARITAREGKDISAGQVHLA